jgi:hypothetical protein
MHKVSAYLFPGKGKVFWLTYDYLTNEVQTFDPFSLCFICVIFQVSSIFTCWLFKIVSWTGQDQAILSVIQYSLGEGVADLILFATTSHEAWGTLEDSFALPCLERADAIRCQLGDTNKRDLSLTAYFN